MLRARGGWHCWLIPKLLESSCASRSASDPPSGDKYHPSFGAGQSSGVPGRARTLSGGGPGHVVRLGRRRRSLGRRFLPGCATKDGHGSLRAASGALLTPSEALQVPASKTSQGLISLRCRRACGNTQLTVIPLSLGSPSPVSIPPAPQSARSPAGSITASCRTHRGCFLVFSSRFSPCPHSLCPLPRLNHHHTQDVMRNKKIRQHRCLFCMRPLSYVLQRPKSHFKK